MILLIEQVLSPEELEHIVVKLENAEFIDGAATAGWHAKQVKHNAQLKGHAPLTQELQGVVNRALQRNSLFQAAIKPKTIRPAQFSRYESGMEYGYHVDNALMGEAPMRSDVSLTLFLSAPSTYTGGELVIDTSLGEQSFKLEAGAMIVYPSSTLHCVAPVTEGIRYAAVTWVQSFVRDAGDREILFDLYTAQQVMFKKSGKTPEFDLVSKSLANLIRKWADV